MTKCSTCGASVGSSYSEAFWELAQHVVIVTASFLLIFAVAIGIDQLVRLSDATQVGKLWDTFGMGVARSEIFFTGWRLGDVSCTSDQVRISCNFESSNMSIAARSFREFFEPLTRASSNSRADLRVSILESIARLDTANDRVRTTASHLFRYASHVVVGAMLFLFLSIPVVLLNLVTGYLATNYQISAALLLSLRVSQFVLVTVALLLFAQFLLRATIDLVRRA